MEIKNYRDFNRNRFISESKNSQIDLFKKAEENGLIDVRRDHLDREIGDDIVKFDSENNRLDIWVNSLVVNDSFTGESLEDLPFRMGEIKGNFYCSGVDSIYSLKGSPVSCNNFGADYCSIKSLEGSPEFCTNFNLNDNLLKDIKGSPKYVFGDFDLGNNLITDLNFGPLIITGSCILGGNPGISKEHHLLFSKMHDFIKKKYFVMDYNLTMKKIEESIRERDYAFSLVVENPDFHIFLGRFENELRDNLGYITSLKDFGVI